MSSVTHKADKIETSNAYKKGDAPPPFLSVKMYPYLCVHTRVRANVGILLEHASTFYLAAGPLLKPRVL